MIKEDRFDEEVMAEVKIASDKLIEEHREIRSVAIVIDWELPPAAIASLPVGAWRMRDGDNVAITTTGMQGQLARMGLHMLQVLMGLHKDVIATATDVKEEGKTS